MEVFLDVALIRCPNCRRLYAESSWYAIELESDIECGECHESFNAKDAVIDRVLLRFDVEGGKIQEVKVAKRLPYK